MFLEGILVHELDKKFLYNFANMPNRPHALLLDKSNAGLDENLINRLGKYLLCEHAKAGKFCDSCVSCKAFNLNAHPDFLTVRVEEKKTAISIEQVKELIGKLSYTPGIGNLRICVLHDAHLLNEASANALLKSLEEPEGECVFLFTTGKPETILPTILSRMIVWRLHRVCQRKLLELLPEDLSPAHKKSLINLSGSDMEKLQKLLAANSMAVRVLAYDFIRGLAGDRLAEESLQSKWNVVHSRENLPEFVFYLTYYLRDLLLMKNNCANLVYNIDVLEELNEFQTAIGSTKIVEILELLAVAEGMHRVNISGKLIVDNLFVQLMNI